MQSLDRDECLAIAENRIDESCCLATNGTGASRLKVSGCGANELIDPCPSSFASSLEIHLVTGVCDVESLVDGPCGEIGELLVRRREFEPVEGSPRNRSEPRGLCSYARPIALVVLSGHAAVAAVVLDSSEVHHRCGKRAVGGQPLLPQPFVASLRLVMLADLPQEQVTSRRAAEGPQDCDHARQTTAMPSKISVEPGHSESYRLPEAHRGHRAPCFSSVTTTSPAKLASGPATDEAGALHYDVALMTAKGATSGAQPALDQNGLAQSDTRLAVAAAMRFVRSAWVIAIT